LTAYGPSPLPADAPRLPAQPPGTPWPTEAWPEGELPAGGDRAAAENAFSRFFDVAEEAHLGVTHALLVVRGGRIVQERYGSEHDADTTLPSWSMAKSLLCAWVGILVGEGRLRLDAPAPVAAWQGADDPRRAITLDQLLRMSSGLAFAEIYDDSGFSDTIEMLFRSGRDDVAAYAAAKPLEAAPDTLWSYSSGTSNIVSRITHEAVDLDGEPYLARLRRALFDRIGMKSVLPRLDARGTWIASSFAFATARDFARFGLLCLRDGCWDGERILPAGWIDYARTPTAHSGGEYGAHFWLAQDGSGIFSANGFRSQYTIMVPDRDLVVVRLGDSEVTQKRALLLALSQLVRAYPTLA